MHFMNPVPVMALVELIRGIATDEETFSLTRDLAMKLGKTPVAAEDFPAFIVNRILLPMINEAVYMLYEGVGSVEAIDTAMKLGANHPMGPLELADFIGLDTCLSVMQVLYEGLADCEIPALSAARQICRGRLARPQDGPRLLRLSRQPAGPDPLTVKTRRLPSPPNLVLLRPIRYQAVTIACYCGCEQDCAERFLVTACLDNCPALVLNADFRPLSYFPLSLWSWQDAIKAVFLDRVNIIDHYDVRVRSPSLEMRLPSVISLKEYMPAARHPAFTRFNVFLRDRFSCQYCGEPYPSHDLTFDHLVPRSRGGRTTWVNVVTACGSCNLLKGNRLPRESGMYPRHRPVQPTTYMLQENGRAFPPNYLHQSWRDYLYWDTELDPF